MNLHVEMAGPAMVWARFDRWAGALLMVFALIALGVSILVISATEEPFIVAAILVAGLAAAVIHLLAVFGLSSGEPWARPVAVMLLWLAILVGLVQTALALAGGGIFVPLGAIGAAFVLRMRPRDRSPWPDDQGRSVAIVLAVFLFSWVLPPGVSYLMQPGHSPLSASPDALGLTASLDCDGAAEQPNRIGVTARWTWKQAEVAPHGSDALVFRWRMHDPDLGEQISPWRFRLADAPGTGFRSSDQGSLYPSREGATGSFRLGSDGSSGDMVLELTQQADGDGARVEPVMIDIDSQHLQDDRFLIVLAPDGSTPRHATFIGDVGYIHAGRWIVWSDTATCSW